VSHIVLHNLIAAALTDPKVCDELLNGERGAVLAEFGLSDEQLRFVSAIEATSIQDFAARLYEWLEAQGNSNML
jgi:hypothetical protein